MSENNSTIEDVRSFWDRRPCNIRHSRAEVGTRDFFDEVEKRKYFVEPHIPGFAEFSNWKNKKVLEIGCGIGTDSVNFARAGADYTGIELSEQSLDMTRKRFQLYGLNGTFYLGNAEQLDSIVSIQKYDLIYSFGVIHHTPNPSKIIDHVKKYMHKESEFRLMLYAENSWKTIMISSGLDQPEAQSG
jgi:2-polyprenyl-3-methyl-5-hydroxy-6-metoxy-1,4-benzoquinol methylase